MKKLSKSLPLFLAAALQAMPLLRSALPAMTQGYAPSTWAIILKLATGAVTLFGYHAISGASGIVISPNSGTNGTRLTGLVQYTGSHSADVKSWQLLNNWQGSQSGCGGPYQIAPGIYLTNAANKNVTFGGTPTQTGTFNFTLKLWDGSGCSGGNSDVQSATLTIYAGAALPSAPVITNQPQSLTNVIGTTASFSVTAGGTAPLSYQWRKNTSTIIPSATNATYSIPNVQSSNAGDFTVVITNSLGSITSSVATLTVICPTITVNPGSLPNGTIGSAYNQSITSSGGAGSYTYSVTLGTLPDGLTLSSGGTLSGIPTNAGNYNFTITSTDANNCSGIRAYSVTVSCPTMTIGPVTLANGTIATAYTQTNNASGGTAPRIFSVSSGSAPAGLTLSSNGEWSGSPTTVGTNTFTVRATDIYGCFGENVYTVAVNCPNITLTPSTLSIGTNATPYNQTITANGGIAPYNFTITSGGLPTGLSLDSNGNISGTPNATGITNLIVTATDANGCTGTRAYSFNIGILTLSISPTSLNNATNGTAYNTTLSASGGSPGYTFSLTNSTLPSGLTLTTNGNINGTPSTTGIYNFTVVATDTLGIQGTRNYNLRVLPTIPDSISPKVKISTPAKNAVVTTAPLTFTGTAADKVALYAVHYWLDDVTNNPATGDATGTTSWSIVLPDASAGAHTLTVVAEDVSGNHSVPASITVHFGTNSFANLGGVYDGLFSSTGTNNFVHQNSGYFQTKVTVKDGKLPTFSVKLSVDGNKVSGAGTFEMNGVGTLKKVIDRSAFNKPNLNVVLTLPFDTSGGINGTVTPVNEAWTSLMTGYKEVATATYAGTYTMVLPGNPANSANEPGGSGYGLVFVDATGVAKIAGSKLADGQTFGQKVILSPAGRWPLYSTASKDSVGAKRSVIMGWLTPSSGGWAGTLAWEKQSGSLDLYYTSGFTTATEVAMSPYNPATTTVLPWTSGWAVFEGGDLTSVLSNSVTLAGGKFTTDKIRKLTLGITAKTGKLSAGFLNPDDGNLKSSGFGVVLTNTATGHGYFLPKTTGTPSGKFTLEAQ